MNENKFGFAIRISVCVIYQLDEYNKTVDDRNKMKINCFKYCVRSLLKMDFVLWLTADAYNHKKSKWNFRLFCDFKIDFYIMYFDRSER